MPQALRDLDLLHPILRDHVQTIQTSVIGRYSMPFRLFETGRTKQRQAELVEKRRARSLISEQFFDLDREPPLYSTGFNLVHYVRRWSWDVRNRTILSWYQLLGELVLDAVPDLEWSGYSRSCSDYTHFRLKRSALLREGIVLSERERVDLRSHGNRSGDSGISEVTEQRRNLA